MRRTDDTMEKDRGNAEYVWNEVGEGGPGRRADEKVFGRGVREGEDG